MLGERGLSGEKNGTLLSKLSRVQHDLGLQIK